MLFRILFVENEVLLSYHETYKWGCTHNNSNGQCCQRLNKKPPKLEVEENQNQTFTIELFTTTLFNQ